MSTTSNIFFSEYERLKTFQNGWLYSFLSPEVMAKCGFYYLGVNDEVKCPFCNVVVFNWSVGDEPIREHIRTSSRCRFINGYDVGNIFIGDDPRTIFNLTPGEDVCGSITSKNLESGKTDSNEPGIPFCEPSHLDFITYDSRLATYADWTSPNIAPTKLAEAGFFFRGVGTVEGIEIVDAVTCFHCGESLSGWTKDDNAWEEHAKFSPKCSFIFLLTAFEVSKRNRNVASSTLLPYSWLSKATDEDPCSVCLEFSVSICFSPCQHSTCSICAAALLKCPICRSNIKRLIKISKEAPAVQTLAIEKAGAEVDKTSSGEIEPENEEEEQAREDVENEESTDESDDSGLVTPSEGMETPSGFSSMSDGMETSDNVLRESEIEIDMKSDENVAPDTIIPKNKTVRVPRTESSTGSALSYDSKSETVAPSIDCVNANDLVVASMTSVDEVPVEPVKPKESENVPVVPSVSVSAEKKEKENSKESDVVAKNEVRDVKKKEPVVAEVSEVAAAPVVAEVKPVVPVSAPVSTPVSKPDSVSIQTAIEQPKKKSLPTQASTSICVI